LLAGCPVKLGRRHHAAAFVHQGDLCAVAEVGVAVVSVGSGLDAFRVAQQGQCAVDGSAARGREDDGENGGERYDDDGGGEQQERLALSPNRLLSELRHRKGLRFLPSLSLPSVIKAL